MSVFSFVGPDDNGSNLHSVFFFRECLNVLKNLPSFFCSACLPRNFKRTSVEWCTVVTSVLRISGPTIPANNPIIQRTALSVGSILKWMKRLRYFEHRRTSVEIIKLLKATRGFSGGKSARDVVYWIIERFREEPTTRRHFVWLKTTPTYAQKGKKNKLWTRLHLICNNIQGGWEKNLSIKCGGFCDFPVLRSVS